MAPSRPGYRTGRTSRAVLSDESDKWRCIIGRVGQVGQVGRVGQRRSAVHPSLGGLESESWRGAGKRELGGGLGREHREGLGLRCPTCPTRPIGQRDPSDPPGRRQKKEDRIPVWDTVLVQNGMPLSQGLLGCDRGGITPDRQSPQRPPSSRGARRGRRGLRG